MPENNHGVIKQCCKAKHGDYLCLKMISQNFLIRTSSKTCRALTALPFDFKAVMESQRKNFEALTEAQQLAMEGLQNVAQRQTEILSQVMEDNANLAKEVMGEGTPEQKVAKQADLIRKNYEKSITNIKEIGAIMNKSNQKASDIINKRVTDSLTEVKAILEKSAKPAPSKAA